MTVVVGEVVVVVVVNIVVLRVVAVVVARVVVRKSGLKGQLCWLYENSSLSHLHLL